MAVEPTTSVLADRWDELVEELCGIVASVELAERQPGAATPRLDRAVARWSRHVPAPADVLALVAEARGRTRASRRHADVLCRVERLGVEEVSRRQVRDALTDPLSGLATRARLDEEAQHLIAAGARSGQPLTVVMLDVDGLKQINDEQGHVAGDEAIADVGRAIRSHLRRADRAFRFGGDEFAVFLPATTADGARALVDRIRASCPVGLSAGVATHSGSAVDTDVAGWLAQADARLYGERRAHRGHRARGRQRPVRRHVVEAVAVTAAAAAASGAGLLGVPSALHGVLDGNGPQPHATAQAAPRTPARLVPVPRTASAPVRTRVVERVVVVVPTGSPTASPAAVPVTLPQPVPSTLPSVVPTAVPVPVPVPTAVPVPTPTPGGLVTGVLRTVGGVLDALL